MANEKPECVTAQHNLKSLGVWNIATTTERAYSDNTLKQHSLNLFSAVRVTESVWGTLTHRSYNNEPIFNEHRVREVVGGGDGN